jgi:hypothetical protein
MDWLIQSLADWLDSLCVGEEAIIPLKRKFTAEPSYFDLPHWLIHILTYSGVSPSVVVQGCVLLGRIHKEYPTLQFSRNNIRRLIFVATMESAKMSEDIIVVNKNWGLISMNVFSCSTLNRMENEFLNLIHYRFIVYMFFISVAFFSFTFQGTC